MTTANTSLTGKVPHTSNSSPSFWNLKDFGLLLVQTLLCAVLQVLENNLATAQYWLIVLKN